MIILLFIFLHSSYAVQPKSQSLLQTTVALETKFQVTLPSYTPYETQIFEVVLKVVNVNGATTLSPKGNITVSVDGVDDYFPVKTNYDGKYVYFIIFGTADTADRPLLAGTHHVVVQFIPTNPTQTQASTGAFDLVITPDVRPTPVIQLSLAKRGRDTNFPFGTLLTLITTFDILPPPNTNMWVNNVSNNYKLYNTLNLQLTNSRDIFLQAGVYKVSAFSTGTTQMKGGQSNFLHFTIAPAQIDTTITVGLDQAHQDGDRWFLPGCGRCGNLGKAFATTSNTYHPPTQSPNVVSDLTGSEPSLPLIIKSAHPNISLSTEPISHAWSPQNIGVLVVKYRRNGNTGAWQIILNGASLPNTTVNGGLEYQNILLQVPEQGLLDFQISFIPTPESWWNPSSITATFLYFVPPANGRYLVNTATVVLNQDVWYYGSTWFAKNNIPGLESFQGYVADDRAGVMCNFPQNIVNNTIPPPDANVWTSVGAISSAQPLVGGLGSVVVENTVVIRVISAPDAAQRRGRVQAILPCPFWWRESSEGGGSGGGSDPNNPPPPPPP